MLNRETFLPKIIDESKLEIADMDPEAQAVKLARKVFSIQTKAKEKIAAAEEFINLLYQLKKTAAKNKIYQTTVIDAEIRRAEDVLAGFSIKQEKNN